MALLLSEMMHATLSADIVSFTSLAESDRQRLREGLQGEIDALGQRYRKANFLGRLISGDQIECALEGPESILRIGLLLKTWVKCFEPGDPPSDKKRARYFREHGLRLAVAVAPLSTLDQRKGVIDGEAIYLSGRKIKQLSTSDKQKIIIKSTLFFCSANADWNTRYEVIFSLLDVLLSKCSAKQSEVLHLKLRGLSESEISKRLKKSQSTISQHSTAAGWASIEKAVDLFEREIP